MNQLTADNLILTSLPEYEGRPSLLMLGCSSALGKLADLLLALANETEQPIELSTLPWIEPVGGVRLKLTPTATEDGQYGLRHRLEAPPTFTWHLNRELALELAEKTRHLAESPGAGHQYLNDALHVEDAQIVLSKGEHDASGFNI